jgi:hypothetical protein
MKALQLTGRRSFEDEIVNELAEKMCSEMDFHILSEMLVQLGWTKVVIKPVTREHGITIDDWVTKYTKGHFETMGLVWLFEDSRDATMFILKWAS